VAHITNRCNMNNVAPIHHKLLNEGFRINAMVSKVTEMSSRMNLMLSLAKVVIGDLGMQSNEVLFVWKELP